MSRYMLVVEGERGLFSDDNDYVCPECGCYLNAMELVVDLDCYFFYCWGCHETFQHFWRA